MASSGVRIGGMELKWGHIIPFYDDGTDLREGQSMLEEDASKPVACVMLRVYANTYAKYAAFITPEAYEAVQDLPGCLGARKPGASRNRTIRSSRRPDRQSLV